MPPSSNLRVSVQYRQSSIFAGEEIEATITFTNIAPPPSASHDRFREPNWDVSSRAPASYAGGERGRKPPRSGQSVASNRQTLARQLSISDKRKLNAGEALPQHMRGRGGHRHTLSLNTSGGASPPNGTANSGRSYTGIGAGGGAQNPPLASRTTHGRTLSILSLGTDVAEPAQPRRAHARASSVQVPRRTPSNAPGNVISPSGSFTYPSPKIPNTYPGTHASTLNEYPFPPSARRSPLSPRRPSPRIHSSRGSVSVSPRPPAFVFPPPSDSGTMTRSPDLAQDELPEPDSAVSPLTQKPATGPRPAKPPDIPQLSRLVSDASASGTPRSSIDFYSQTNNSNETLASEYIQPSTSRWFSRPDGLLRRTSSQRASSAVRSAPESLMMGYAQIMGSFSVDGSLINQAPFEEVKRKGIIGTQGGGGVVGLERTKRESGLFGALGWGTIGESLTGILGGGELSSIKEMRGVAKDKNVPLLSTPQSILFVDLRLLPGESRAYTYSFKLPKGLPPSHKGRAIKLSYWITIGVQRSGGPKDGGQQVKSVDVPFRVLGSVNNQGEILGHDLMSPYIILRDQAKTGSIVASSAETQEKKKRHVNGVMKSHVEAEGLAEFGEYITHLLARSRGEDSTPTSALLSPTADSVQLRRRRSSQAEEPMSMKEAIDLAILRSGVLPGGSKSRSNTRFDIARSGLHVAVVTLSRPAFRLGDTLNLSIDFEGADIPTYALNVSLDTTEIVDPSIALRSASSITRVTKKIHAAWAENTLFARRVGVSLGVPWNAVPEMLTTGISVTWKVRIEFVGPKLEILKGSDTAEDGDLDTPEQITNGVPEAEDQVARSKQQRAAPGVRLEFPKLLDDATTDQRGTSLKPVDKLQCDSFEVEVPIRVYGAVVETGETTNEEGLVL